MRNIPSYRLFLLLLAAIFLSPACGSPGSDDNTESTPPVGQPPRPLDCNAALTPSNQGGPLYIALGDSFSSGEGAPAASPLPACGAVFLPALEGEDAACHRSSEAWPVQLAASIGYSNFELHACSGSVIQDYFEGPNQGHRDELRSQRSWLLDESKPRKNVDLVTLTLGGNDAQFANVMGACASVVKKRLNSCLAHIAPANLGIQKLSQPANDDFFTWAQLFRDLLTSAPNAEILIVGYPRFFSEDIPQEGCGTGGGVNFTEAEMIAINQAVDQANRAMQYVAESIGPRIRFVDVGRAFEDHGICDSENWINRAIPSDAQQSFHPNALGQQAIAQAVSRCYLENVCAVSREEVDPVLGLTLDERAQGLGTSQPPVIDLGGLNNTGLVTDIEWTSWGESEAVGRGIGAYVPPGAYIAEAQRGDAQVVAFELGNCDGVLAYRKVSWFFPEFGETFNPANSVEICTLY